MSRLTRRVVMAGVKIAPPGQQEWTTPGTYSFVVPNNVFSISPVLVGAGGGGARTTNTTTEYAGGGAGGALRYASAIAVLPGETLTVIVGSGRYKQGGIGSTNEAGSNGGDTILQRGTTVLLRANGGKGGRIDGQFAAGGTGSGGTGGGSGGQGGNGSTSLQRLGGAGGAAGYAGAGGDGGGVGDGNAGASGGGGGGSARQTGNWSGYGGGVGIRGQGSSGSGGSGDHDDGDAGSSGDVPGYGGGGRAITGATGAATQSGHGAARIIWGEVGGVPRAFPSTNTGNV